MKNLVVIGSSGYIARAVLSELSTNFGWKVTALSRADYVDSATLEGKLRALKPTHILNCVGVLSAESDQEFFRWNVEFSSQVLDCAQNLEPKPKKVLLIGSAAEYGIPKTNPVKEDAEFHPVSPYGRSKTEQSAIARKAYAEGFPVHVGRIFNIIGPGMTDQLNVGAFIRKVKDAPEGGGIEVSGSLDSVRDYLDIRDVAGALVRILEAQNAPAEINICSGVPVVTKDLLETLIAQAGKKQHVLEGRHKDSRNTASVAYGDPKRLQGLGWKRKYSLSEALRYALFAE